ncbi:MAG: prolyl oligopeptidase family serine peptidase [Nocardioidaceae bacterium]|nr:MAG: prolyl oligopeptidase family serine peptidase [Nocardioidaceae bacterium]
MRYLVPFTVSLVLLTGCTTADQEPGSQAPATNVAPTTVPTPAPISTPTPTATPTEPPHPVSLPAYFDRPYRGTSLKIGATLTDNADYRESDATFTVNGLSLSGQLLVPQGKGPFPAVVMAHGYIDPAIYTSGRGLTREQDWLARRGYVVLHVDYRNHAWSDKDPDADLELRLGYTEDVIGAALSLRKQKWVDGDRMAILGRSMGGGVVYNALAARPGLFKAGIAFAPVSSLARENFERWTRPDPGRGGLVARIIDAYGEPSDNPEFWAEASARTFFDRITEPVLIHHGTSDDTCPIRWSRQTHRAMKAVGVDVTLRVYDGEQHAFGPQQEPAMQRTLAFLAEHGVR